jgi:hypothetical protein
VKQDMQRGAVGYYRISDFVHMDVGACARVEHAIYRVRWRSDGNLRLRWDERA